MNVTVTRSAGPDGAVLVFIDTEFEPDGSDEGPGLRVYVNDDPVYVGKECETDDTERAAREVLLGFELAGVDYTEE